MLVNTAGFNGDTHGVRIIMVGNGLNHLKWTQPLTEAVSNSGETLKKA